MKKLSILVLSLLLLPVALQAGTAKSKKGSSKHAKTAVTAQSNSSKKVAKGKKSAAKNTAGNKRSMQDTIKMAYDEQDAKKEMLVEAVCAGDSETARALFEEQIPVDKAGGEMYNLMLCAVSANSPKTLDVLVENGCDLTGALCHAARNGSLEVVKYLVNKKNVDVNERWMGCQTPLKEATNKGHVVVVKFLKSKGATMN